jgi:hypothetical protein
MAATGIPDPVGQVLRTLAFYRVEVGRNFNLM